MEQRCNVIPDLSYCLHQMLKAHLCQEAKALLEGCSFGKDCVKCKILLENLLMCTNSINIPHVPV